MVQAAITAGFTLSQGVKPVLMPRTELVLLPGLSRISSLWPPGSTPQEGGWLGLFP